MTHPVDMRLLVACPECQRQFDASRLDVGDRFHCLCGELLRVPAVDAHEAAVVRCSSCGAPRQQESTACSFCGADFTLHERDLHTICPHCMARVSDRARYCHHCATPLVPSGEAGTASEFACPACSAGRRLISRRLDGGGIGILECPSCGGLWLARDQLEVALAQARDESFTSTMQAQLDLDTVQPAAGSRPGGALYRPCPVCGKLMHRRNFGRKSGVIVDQCQPDGIWFDSDELAKVLHWIRRGGEVAVARSAREEEAEMLRRRALAQQLEAGDHRWPPSVLGPGSGIELLGWILKRIFRRRES